MPGPSELWYESAKEQTYQRTGSYLLPQGLRRFTPPTRGTCDGYPCARLDTTVAGACSVILKVFFDEGALMSNCVQHAAADGLTLEPCPSDFVPTVGNEINKWCLTWRWAGVWAGIHYRSDSTARDRAGRGRRPLNLAGFGADLHGGFRWVCVYAI